MTGIIDSLDDRDWFAVEMEAGEAYHARLSYMTEDGLRSFANGRVVLGCLTDADGSDSPDTCLYKGRVEFEVQQRGTYYIVVQPRWYRADLGHPRDADRIRARAGPRRGPTPGLVAGSPIQRAPDFQRGGGGDLGVRRPAQR